MPVVYSIVELPKHPNLSALYRARGLHEFRFGAMRQAIKQLKKDAPDYVVADFVYGYGNNYAGVNISNLDVFLHSLEKYAPGARVIVFAERAELAYADRLAALFPIHGILAYPVTAGELAPLLLGGNPS